MPRFWNIDGARALRILAALAVLFAIYFARDVLIPTAMAGLLTFLLYPMVRWLQRRARMPRSLAVAACVTGLLLVTLAVAAIVFRQAVDLTAKLPDYTDNIRSKIRDIRATGKGFGRFTGTLDELKKELASTNPATNPVGAAAGRATGRAPDEPVKVEMVNREAPGFGDVATRLAMPLVFPLEEAGITLLILIFLLQCSEDVRERLIWLAGMRQMSLTTAALDESGARIAGYLRMLLVVNVSFGAMMTLGLLVIGVPGAVMWGVVAGILRFIPFIGPWLGAAMPTLLAVAVSPGWGMPLAVVGWVLVVELFVNMILEPWLYGHSTGISSLGVVFGVVVWAWLWGPVGLILAVPLTVCLVVLGKYVPSLAVFNQLFGTEGAVPEVARLYQRLLIGDETAAEEIVTERLKTGSLVKLADELLLPVLCELKRDHSAGLIAREQAREAVRTLEMVLPGEVPTRPVPGSNDAAEHFPRLLAVPGPGIIDEAAARLLARTAVSESIPAEASSSHALASEVAARAVECGASAVCIVQLAPVTASHARHIVKTLAHRLRGAAESLQLYEMMSEGQCLLEAATTLPGGAAPVPTAAPALQQREPLAPQAASNRSGEPAVNRVRSTGELIDRLSDLRQPAKPETRGDETSSAAKPKPEPEPAPA